MLTTVEGFFRDGHIELREAPPVEQARVIVTFLPELLDSGSALPHSVSEANRRILALLQAWQAEPLTADEELLLDELEDFQSRHPLRFTTLQEES
jgi:hypothetical protein